MLCGVDVVEEHLGQLVRGEDAMAINHGEDGSIPLGQTMGHRHDHPAVDLWSRSSFHTNHPNESGFATGGVRPAARWKYWSPDPVLSGLATLLAGVVATPTPG